VQENQEFQQKLREKWLWQLGVKSVRQVGFTKDSFSDMFHEVVDAKDSKEVAKLEILPGSGGTPGKPLMDVPVTRKKSPMAAQILVRNPTLR
jgi:hypothetical protein